MITYQIFLYGKCGSEMRKESLQQKRVGSGRSASVAFNSWYQYT